MGYINPETFEVVIPAQYAVAGYFIGDFAIVRKDPDKNTRSIINKQNVVIISNVHRAHIYASEDGTNVFAFTQVHSGIMRSNFTSPGFVPFRVFDPRHTIYRVYNLTTGKLLLSERGDYMRNDRGPRVMFIDNYMIYFGIVYEIMNDGNLKKIEITVEDFMERAIEERNLRRVENDFHFNESLLFDSYFWYVAERFDIEQLFQNIPDHLVLLGNEQSDWRFRDRKPVYQIRPINRDAVYPLRRNRLLYEVELGFKLEGEGRVSNRSMGSERRHFGLWDAVENEWVIYPIQSTMRSLTGFRQTEYAEWIHMEGQFYNILTRKKYRQKYFIIRNYAQDFTNTSIMTYAGFMNDDRKNEIGEYF